MSQILIGGKVNSMLAYGAFEGIEQCTDLKEFDDSDVADITGAPEMLGGRVKTLHPAVHGG